MLLQQLYGYKAIENQFWSYFESCIDSHALCIMRLILSLLCVWGPPVILFFFRPWVLLVRVWQARSWTFTHRYKAYQLLHSTKSR